MGTTRSRIRRFQQQLAFRCWREPHWSTLGLENIATAARGVLPSPGDASGHDAAREFETLVEQVLTAAPQEHMMRRLGQALSQTTRLVNTLEQRVAVRLSADLAEMRRTLSERDREEHLRIKRIIAQRAHRQSATAPD